jgi:hypothetical protein
MLTMTIQTLCHSCLTEMYEVNVPNPTNKKNWSLCGKQACQKKAKPMKLVCSQCKAHDHESPAAFQDEFGQLLCEHHGRLAHQANVRITRITTETK